MSVWRDKRGRLHVSLMHRRRRVHRVCPEGTSLEQAKRWENKLRQELFRTIDLGETPEIPLTSAIKRYLDEEVVRHKTARNTRLRAYAMEDYLVGQSLTQISSVAERIIRERGRSSAATLNRKLSILKRTANLAYRKWGWLREPLADKIQLVAGERARHTYLDAAQVDSLASALAPPGGDAVFIAAYTGLRWSELWSLTPIMVKDSVIYLATSKNEAPRAVPVIPKIRRALARWLKAEKPTKSTFHRHFQEAVKSLGWKDVVFHTLRHSCASMLVAQGVDLYTVGQILGHKSPRTTARYAHLSLESKRKALRRIG